MRMTRTPTSESELRRERIIHQLKLQRFLARFACICQGLTVFVALFLFCLQGFHAWGFNLEIHLMHWLGIATVGAVSGFASIVYKAAFKESGRVTNGK